MVSGWFCTLGSQQVLMELMLGGIRARRRRGQQRMRWLDGITDSMDMSLSKPGVGDGQGGPACCSSWGHKESDMTERLNWTEWYYHDLICVGTCATESEFWQRCGKVDCLALTVFYLVHSDNLISLLLLSLVTPPLPSSHCCQSELSKMSTVRVSLLLKTLLCHLKNRSQALYMQTDWFLQYVMSIYYVSF